MDYRLDHHLTWAIGMLESQSSNRMDSAQRNARDEALHHIRRARLLAAPCAWCEEADSPLYRAHEGHDPDCPL